jgi:hypothetical protein
MKAVLVTISIFNVRYVRNFIKSANTSGFDVTLNEGSGWISRPMWIVGSDAYRVVKLLQRALNLEEFSST